MECRVACVMLSIQDGLGDKGGEGCGYARAGDCFFRGSGHRNFDLCSLSLGFIHLSGL